MGKKKGKKREKIWSFKNFDPSFVLGVTLPQYFYFFFSSVSAK